MRHFASASCLKFSHADHNIDNDWIFNLNEISISYRNQTIQWPIAFSVFVEHGFVVGKTHTSIKKKVHKRPDLNVTCKHSSKRIFLISISTFIIACVLGAIWLSTWFLTIGQCIWLSFCLICKFHWVWRSNRYLFWNRRVKILACSLKGSVPLFGKW